MTRLLLPTPEYPPVHGGVARYLAAIAETFPQNVEVVVWPRLPSLTSMIGAFSRQRQSYDQLLVSHILPIGTAAMIAGFMTGKPYSIILHGLDFDLALRNNWKRWLSWQILRRARRVITNSQALANEVGEFASRSDVLVVQPSVDDALVRLAGGHVRADRPLDFRPVKLLSVARLVERKGHEKVLRVLSRLPNTSYTIVGSGPNGPRLRQITRELQLEDRVFFAGDVDDEQLAEFYRSADIFVLPSTKSTVDREGFGIVYLEAGLFSLPVIAVRQPGVDEAIVDGETGLLIDDTSEELYRALHTLVNDPEKRTMLGEQGRTRVLREFTREQQFTKFSQLL